MRRMVFVLALCVSSNLAFANLGQMRKLATDVRDDIATQLQRCNLRAVAGNSIRIESWILDFSGSRFLARYDESVGLNNVSMTWQNPNGSERFRISYNDDGVEFINSRMGQVGRVNFQKDSTNGRYPVYRSRCARVDLNDGQLSQLLFQECVQKYFTNVIIDQLCRYGR